MQINATYVRIVVSPQVEVLVRYPRRKTVVLLIISFIVWAFYAGAKATILVRSEPENGKSRLTEWIGW